MSALRLIGLGVDVPAETTLEALLSLEECRPAFAHGLAPEAFAWLSRQVPGVRSARAPREVVDAAARGGPAGLAVWGHPEFTSAFAREVQRLCRARGVEFSVAGAVSPMASAFARSVSFLGGEYGYQGIQAYALPALLAEPSRWTPRLPLVAHHDGAGPARWAGLAKRLARSLPPGRRARVYVPGRPERLMSPEELASLGGERAVVFVPPAGGEPRSPGKRAG